jgi:NADH-quinone oxidoreductase subunit C
MSDSPLLNTLKAAYADYIVTGVDTTDGFPCLEIGRDNIATLCAKLKQDSTLQFDFLSDICGVDYYPQTPRFEVVYHLYSIPFKYRLRLKCKLAEGESIPTITRVWNTANWHEREAFDMYGIVFSGHPDLRRIYLWDGFEGYPQRKDFPLRGYRDEYNPFGEEPAVTSTDQGKNDDEGWSH